MRAALLVLICVLGLAGQARAAEPVRIALLIPHSGTLATGIRASKVPSSVQMAVEEVSRKGGLQGRPIELIELDTASTPLNARAAAREAVRLGVIAVIGDSKSTMALAIAPVLQQAGIVMISPNSTHPDLTAVGDYIFRLSFVDSFQGRVMAQFARDDLKAASAVVLTNISARYSEELSRHFIEQFEARGGKVSMVGEYLQDASDFAPMLARVKALKPDVLFIPGYARDAGALMRQARAMSITSVVLGGDGWGARAYDYGGAAVVGSYHTAHWHRGDPSPMSRDFVRRFERRLGPISTDAEALYYDAVHVLADAVRRARSLDPARVRDALRRTRGLVRVTGTISFDAGRNARKGVAVVRNDGERTVFVRSVAP